MLNASRWRWRRQQLLLLLPLLLLLLLLLHSDFLKRDIRRKNLLRSGKGTGWRRHR
jgi:hypothetical protein